MKKFKEGLLFFMCIGTLCSCGGTSLSGSVEKGNIIASRIVNSEKGTYIEVDGKPFIYTGIQLRTDAFMNCEYKTAAQLEPYFKAAAALNINTIQIPIDWNDIEISFDVYDFSVIETFLGLALKYNLKAEFLWFSTNMCGETHSYHIPDYIVDDAETYPRYDTTYTGQFWPYYGYILHLEFGHDNLLARETKVVKKIMNYVFEWEKKNDNPNTLIGVQVHNEPDCFPLWRVGHNQISVKKDGVQITYEEAVATVNKALNEVGKAFKSTPYKIITRVNFALANKMNDYIRSVFELEGIDIVGDDPHEDNIATIKDVIANEYALAGNYPHIAENRATYQNTPSLILTTLVNGGGYILYEVATSSFFIRHATGSIDPDYGIYNTDLTLRGHTKDVTNFLNMVNNLGGNLVTAGKNNIIGFNLENNYPSGNYNKNLNIKNTPLNFVTNSGAIGCIINCDDYLLVCTNKVAELSGLNNNWQVTKGRYENEEWTTDEEVSLNDGKLNLEGYVVYKICL